MKILKSIHLIAALSGCLFITSCHNDEETLKDDDLIVEYKTQDLQPHKGSMSQFASMRMKEQFAGAGYDIMGKYSSIYSMKKQVLAIEKLPDGAYTTTKLSGTSSEVFTGKNALEFLEAIETRGNFKDVVPVENLNDLLFVGSAVKDSHWESELTQYPFEYSSMFSFAALNNNYKHGCQLINTQQTTLNEALFTDILQSDLQELTPEEIIEEYGTHVIIEAVVGLATHATFRAVSLTNREESIYDNALYYASKLVYDNYTPTTSQREALATSYCTTTLVEFKGGEPTLIPTMHITNSATPPIAWNETELSNWRQSCDASETLVEIPEKSLIPLYSLISDATLQAKIKEATINYIKSNQPNYIVTTPLVVYKEINGKGYHYNTDRADCEAIGVLAALYDKQMPGTSPLYLYANKETERLSFDSNLESDMTKIGVIGYCYEASEYRCDKLIEKTDGIHYQYMLNEGDYSKEWKETGVCIYTKQMTRM